MYLLGKDIRVRVGILEFGKDYLFITVTVFFGILVTLFARSIILWREIKAKETNINQDDTAKRFKAGDIEIAVLNIETLYGKKSGFSKLPFQVHHIVHI